MADNVNAEIVAIGTELLLGEITDTNSVYLARKFRDLGINLYFMTSVGDNLQRIADAIRLAMSRADVVITCGGLGPTIDDMTRQSIADATDRKLVYHQELYNQIEARFSTFNVKMTENNSRQAYLPADAIIIENPVGTAPSFVVEHEGKSIISLPGVPREMKYLFENRIEAYLRQKYQLGIIKARILKTAGIGESSLDDMLGDELLNMSNPTIGLAAHHGIIDIRMTAKADDEAQADVMLAIIEAKVREQAGEYIWGSEKDQLEDTLADLVTAQSTHIAVVEAGITNAIITKLTNKERDDILSESIEFQHPDNIISAFADTESMSLREAAHYLAETIATRNNSIAGIAILSLPDVNENRDDEIATVVATYVNGEVKSRVYGFGAKNSLTADWVSRWAMAYVWRQIKEASNDN